MTLNQHIAHHHQCSQHDLGRRSEPAAAERNVVIAADNAKAQSAVARAPWLVAVAISLIAAVDASNRITVARDGPTIAVAPGARITAVSHSVGGVAVRAEDSAKGCVAGAQNAAWGRPPSGMAGLADADADLAIPANLGTIRISFRKAMLILGVS